MPVQHAQIEQQAALVTVTFEHPEVTTVQMQELTAELMEKMRYDNAQMVVCDMTGVKFISSGCLGILVELVQDLEHIRGRIALCNCSDNVAFLFRVTRLDNIFPLFDDLEQAKEELLG